MLTNIIKKHDSSLKKKSWNMIYNVVPCFWTTNMSLCNISWHVIREKEKLQWSVALCTNDAAGGDRVKNIDESLIFFWDYLYEIASYSFTTFVNVYFKTTHSIMLPHRLFTVSSGFTWDSSCFNFHSIPDWSTGNS